MKVLKILIIIGVVAVILTIAVIGVVYINLNKEKTPITSSNFYSTMQQKGYSVYDMNSQYSNYDYIKQVYIATSGDSSYQIEFYEFLDDSYAARFFQTNKYEFESLESNVSAKTNSELKNYAKYTLSSNGMYMVVSQIDNTAIYVKASNKYKDTIKDVLDELGY